MTHIEKATKEALRDGWHEGYSLQHFGDFGDVLLVADKGARSIALVVAEVFLDPSFWQALGKARGWVVCEDSSVHTKPAESAACTSNEWFGVWHRFIDHLAEGKDAESFFATLL